jgi:energy-coupling factor transporter ATP-binding protein EcfA2
MIRNPSIRSLLPFMDEQGAKDIKRMMITHPVKEVLEYADHLMGMNGVEDLWPDHPNFQYVNTGETYKNTLCHDGRRYLICSWGDWVEGNDYKRAAKTKTPFINL